VRLNSVILLAVGAIIEIAALGSLPLIDPTMSDEEILQAFMAPGVSGALVVALAGALVIVAGVANDRRTAN
jgi:hypothetical protein